MPCTARNCENPIRCRSCNECWTHCQCPCSVNFCIRRKRCDACIESRCGNHCQCFDAIRMFEEYTDLAHTWKRNRTTGEAKTFRKDVHRRFYRVGVIPNRSSQHWLEYDRLAKMIKDGRILVIDSQFFPFQCELVNDVGSVYDVITPKDMKYLHLMGESITNGDMSVSGNDVLEAIAGVRRGCTDYLAEAVQVIGFKPGVTLHGVEVRGSLELGGCTCSVLGKREAASLTVTPDVDLFVCIDSRLVQDGGNFNLGLRIPSLLSTTGYRALPSVGDLSIALVLERENDNSEETRLIVNDYDLMGDDGIWYQFRTDLASRYESMSHRNRRLRLISAYATKIVKSGTIDDYPVCQSLGRVVKMSQLRAAEVDGNITTLTSGGIRNTLDRIAAVEKKFGPRHSLQDLAEKVGLQLHDILVALNSTSDETYNSQSACYLTLAEHSSGGRNLGPLRYGDILRNTLYRDRRGFLRDRGGTLMEVTEPENGVAHVRIKSAGGYLRDVPEDILLNGTTGGFKLLADPIPIAAQILAWAVEEEQS